MRFSSDPVGELAKFLKARRGAISVDVAAMAILVALVCLQHQPRVRLRPLVLPVLAFARITKLVSSFFGGQRSIQLSYGCFRRYIAHGRPPPQWRGLGAVESL